MSLVTKYCPTVQETQAFISNVETCFYALSTKISMSERPKLFKTLNALYQSNVAENNPAIKIKIQGTAKTLFPLALQDYNEDDHNIRADALKTLHSALEEFINERLAGVQADGKMKKALEGLDYKELQSWSKQLGVPVDYMVDNSDNTRSNILVRAVSIVNLKVVELLLNKKICNPNHAVPLWGTVLFRTLDSRWLEEEQEMAIIKILLNFDANPMLGGNYLLFGIYRWAVNYHLLNKPDSILDLLFSHSDLNKSVDEYDRLKSMLDELIFSAPESVKTQNLQALHRVVKRAIFYGFQLFRYADDEPYSAALKIYQEVLAKMEKERGYTLLLTDFKTPQGEPSREPKYSVLAGPEYLPTIPTALIGLVLDFLREDLFQFRQSVALECWKHVETTEKDAKKVAEASGT